MRRFVLILAILGTSLSAMTQGKIMLGNDALHLITDLKGVPIPVGGWTQLTMQLMAGTNAANMNLQTTIVGDAISSLAVYPGRINNTPITLVGVPTGANVYLELRFFPTAMGSYNAAAAQCAAVASPVFTVTTGSFAHNSIVSHGSPGFSTWPDGQGVGIPLGGCYPCSTPFFTRNPSSTSVSLGSDVTLYAWAYPCGMPPLNLFRYQWRKEGEGITGATNSFLTLTKVTLADAGHYDVVASTDYGSNASSVATVTVFTPVIAATLGSPNYSANKQFQFTVTGTAGSNYVVQVSTNLSAKTDWVSLFTNASPFIFADTNTSNFPRRFYRAYSP
ncbi:MAG: hypothetical protein IT579_13100 [Verrucomicrobia subdivision 3 bacterium]|nr:hypothetical protein [Limisphaerales bacterium]